MRRIAPSCHARARHHQRHNPARQRPRPPCGQDPARYHGPPMDALHIVDLESAINHWRARAPSQAGAALAPEVAALAEVYARMAIAQRQTLEVAALSDAARSAWLAWYDTTPDTPCIAICSTNQGDAVCKGCGRTEDEVRHWLSMGPFAKRAVWQRITLAQTAWRFTRYAERARDVASVGPAPTPAHASGPAVPVPLASRSAPIPAAVARAAAAWPACELLASHRPPVV